MRNTEPGYACKQNYNFVFDQQYLSALVILFMFFLKPYFKYATVSCHFDRFVVSLESLSFTDSYNTDSVTLKFLINRKI